MASKRVTITLHQEEYEVFLRFSKAASLPLAIVIAEQAVVSIRKVELVAERLLSGYYKDPIEGFEEILNFRNTGQLEVKRDC